MRRLYARRARPVESMINLDCCFCPISASDPGSACSESIRAPAVGKQIRFSLREIPDLAIPSKQHRLNWRKAAERLHLGLEGPLELRYRWKLPSAASEWVDNGIAGDSGGRPCNGHLLRMRSVGRDHPSGSEFKDRDESTIPDEGMNYKFSPGAILAKVERDRGQSCLNKSCNPLLSRRFTASSACCSGVWGGGGCGGVFSAVGGEEPWLEVSGSGREMVCCRT